jgi:glycosyltransferase involved in cell wall biosynthesis/GR25 family glycosyltransferase involved in LPS biosynthesis
MNYIQNKKVAVISILTDEKYLYNIILNFKQQHYITKKLFIISNKLVINIEYELINIEYEIINLDDNYDICDCFNYMIFKLKQENYDIFSYFHETDIYKSEYLIQQIFYLNQLNYDIVSKSNITIFNSDEKCFYTNIFVKCHTNCITFNISLQIYFEDTLLDTLNKYSIYLSNCDNYIYVNNNYNNNKIDYNVDTIYSNLINILFDKIYVINLKKDKLKREIFINNNGYHNINFTFFEGIDGKEDLECNILFNEYNKKPVCYEGCSMLEKKYKRKFLNNIGEVGYLFSLYNIFNDALSKNYKKIIIFDDDALFINDFPKLFYEKLSIVPQDWSILRIGSTWHYIKHNLEHIKNCEYYKTLPLTDGSFAICYSQSTFKKLITLIEDWNCVYDSGILCYIEEAKDYTVYPFIVIADTYYSYMRQSRNLYLLSEKLMWNLSKFDFKNSLRKVSVIIITENNQDTILFSCYSILNQSYSNIELIIIDNCSSDDTCILIEKYNKNIKLIKQTEKLDYYLLKNIGIQQSTGDYITFQNGSDISLITRIEKQMNDIIKKNIRISYCLNSNITNINQIFNNNIINENLEINSCIIDKLVFKKYGMYLEQYSELLFIIKNYCIEYGINILDIDNINTFIINNIDTKKFMYCNKELLFLCFNNDYNKNNHDKFYNEQKKIKEDNRLKEEKKNKGSIVKIFKKQNPNNTQEQKKYPKLF